jgi:hypothetical protein
MQRVNSYDDGDCEEDYSDEMLDWKDNERNEKKTSS